MVANSTQGGLRYGHPQANCRSRCLQCGRRSVHDGIGTLHGREKKNHQNAQHCQYNQITSRAARNHSTYYIAALELPDSIGKRWLPPLQNLSVCFTLILLALSYPVYLSLGLRKELPASVSDAIPVPAK